MSWTEGARPDFTPNLVVDGDKIAYVEMAAEPREVDFGMKTVKRQGKDTKIADIRHCTQVIYRGGNARANQKNPDTSERDFFDPIVGEEYTLWLPETLIRAMLKGLNWTKGNPAPLVMGTKWKVWRSEQRRGAHRLYAAELLKEFSSFSESTLETTYREGEVETSLTTPESDYITDPQLKSDAHKYVGVIKPIGEIDLANWQVYCERQGFTGKEGNASWEELTDVMVAEGLVEVDKSRNKIIYKGK